MIIIHGTAFMHKAYKCHKVEPLLHANNALLYNPINVNQY